MENANGGVESVIKLGHEGCAVKHTTVTTKKSQTHRLKTWKVEKNEEINELRDENF